MVTDGGIGRVGGMDYACVYMYICISIYVSISIFNIYIWRESVGRKSLNWWAFEGQHSENFLESMRVSLGRTPSNEIHIFCSEERFLVSFCWVFICLSCCLRESAGNPQITQSKNGFYNKNISWPLSSGIIKFQHQQLQ